MVISGVKRQLHKYYIALLGMACMLLLAACGKSEAPEEVQIKDNTSGSTSYKFVLTTGFARDEVFQIEQSICKKPEMMLYLVTLQNQYENVYGSEIWNVEIETEKTEENKVIAGTEDSNKDINAKGIKEDSDKENGNKDSSVEAGQKGNSLEQNVKNNALAKVAQIKTMNLMASSYGTSLTTKEVELVEAAAKEFFDSLNETEKSLMEVDYDTIFNAYSEYALAQKLYGYIIKDINPEVSDDEARTIKVQHILIKTYAKDGTGKKISYTENSRRKAKEKAEEVYALAMEGTDFDEVIRTYGDNEAGTISFGKGEVDPVMEEIAFNLSKGQISEVIETEDGYVILKCISTFDKVETDANKLKIVEKKRKEVFEEQYNVFVDSLTRHLNQKLWNEITFIHDEKVKTSDFFDVIERYCEKMDAE